MQVAAPRARWAIRLLTLAAIIPLMAGVSSYVLNAWSIHATGASWQTGLGPLPFGLGEIEGRDRELGAFLRSSPR